MGSGLTINSTTGVITANAGTIATTTTTGIVKIGNGLSIIADGTLSLVQATSVNLGGVRPDANTIVTNATTGVISSVQTQADWTNTDTSSRAFIQNKPTILNSKWTSSGVNIYYNSGSVGIGTTNPLSLLDINTTNYTGAILTLDAGIVNATTQMARSIGKPLMKLGKTSYSSTAGDYYGIGFGYSPTDFNCAEIGVLITSVSGQETGDIVFSTRPNTTNVAPTERMRIKSDGNIGIGTTNPNYKLDVNGDVYVGNNSYFLSDHTGTPSSQFFGKKYNNTILGGMEIENTTLGGNYSQKLHFHTHTYGGSYGRRMTIAENGNINIDRLLQIGGINNYNGGNIIKLRVYASDDVGTCAIFKHPNDTQGIGIRYDGIFQTNTNSSLNLTTSGTGAIYFNTNGAERMRVYTDGSIRTL